MKAQTQTILDQRAFGRLKRIMPNLLEGHRCGRQAKASQPQAIPDEVAFKLTNRCTLRCHHCYQWGDKGHHHHLSPEAIRTDLDISLIEKVLNQTRDVGSNLYFWGGEPLIYRKWNRLIELLTDDPRWTTFCTNGIALERRLPSMLPISEHLEVLVAVDGFAAEHDALRGKDSWAAALGGIDAVLAARRAGTWRGEIAVNFVISASMAERVYDYVKFFDEHGVDTVMLSLPWYVSPESSMAMADYVARHFSWMNLASGVGSWDAHYFHVPPDLAGRLSDAFERVNSREWRVKVRYNPPFERDELALFLSGKMARPRDKVTCMALKGRLDVMADGSVTPCKFISEFAVGNLHDASVPDVWHGARLNRFRETVDTELTPMCTSCNLLYSRGI